PNVLKIYEFGLVDSSYYISYEFMEGKSLKAIFARCRQDGFPFSVDHGLLIVSKLCSALEYAQARKNEAGSRYFHGLVSPANVMVSYEGEVRLRGFGYWPSRIRELKALIAEDSRYLAPEQAAGGAGDTRSDVFALGVILFETLTGEPLRKGEGAVDVPARLAQARLQSPTTDDDALPKPIAAILQRALAVDPAARYPEIQEMRKAIDTLLFSGDFTPTTFNLAFFMHSLFREDIEQESKLLKDEKDADYVEYLSEEPSATAAAAGAAPAGAVATLRTDTQALRPPAAPGQAEAAEAKVKELQEKLAALEAEKASAEAKAAEDARKKVEAQAAAKGQVVDPAALAKAQEEARRKAQAEQERRAQEEKKRLEAE